MPITTKKIVHTRQVPGFNFEIWRVELEDGGTRYMPYFWKLEVPNDRIGEGAKLRDELDTYETIPEANNAGREIYLILTGKAKALRQAGSPDLVTVACANCKTVGTTELPTDELVIKEGGKLLAGRSIRGLCGACGQETEFIPVSGQGLAHIEKLEKERKQLREKVQGTE